MKDLTFSKCFGLPIPRTAVAGSGGQDGGAVPSARPNVRCVSRMARSR